VKALRGVLADIEDPRKEALCHWWGDYFHTTWKANQSNLPDLGVCVLTTLDTVAGHSPERRHKWYANKVHVVM
jgi:hypothetical protein